MSRKFISMSFIFIVEGSLEVKLPTLRTHGKAEVERVREEKRGLKIKEANEPDESTVVFQ